MRKPDYGDVRYKGLDFNSHLREYQRDNMLWEQNEQLKKLNNSNNSNYTYQYRASSTFEVKLGMLFCFILTIIFLLIRNIAGYETLGTVMAFMSGFAFVGQIPSYIVCKMNEKLDKNKGNG